MFVPLFIHVKQNKLCAYITFTKQSKYLFIKFQENTVIIDTAMEIDFFQNVQLSTEVLNI